jgi:hypothetical protein
MPKVIPELLGRFFLALANLPAVNQHVVLVSDAIDRMEPKDNLPKRIGAPPHVHALFFDVMTVKTDQLCSTSSLLQYGHTTSPSSYSAGDKVFENSCLHAWQKNS